jgi:hypothetical protein
VQLDELLRQRESEPGPLVLPGERRVELGEFLEKPG